MIKDTISRTDISLACFQSREEVYLASFNWSGDELHTFGRKCGKGGVFLMKNAKGKCIGFITFSIAPEQKALTMNTGGTTGKYRNLGYGIPLLDSFYSLMFVMGIEEMTITSGVDNPYVLRLIDIRYGFGAEAKHPENAMMIGGAVSQHAKSFPVYFLGEAARQRIQQDAREAKPDPFGPSYRIINEIGSMPSDSSTVYVGEFYRIADRLRFFRRILNFLPELHHRPDSTLTPQRIIWKSRSLSLAQSHIAAADN